MTRILNHGFSLQARGKMSKKKKDRNIEKRKLIQERHGYTDGGKKENLKGTKLKKVNDIRNIKLISSLGIQREKNSQRQSKIIGRDNDDSE